VLLELRVAGLGIVDELTLLFQPGLTAITGETGAGKTLIVEAIELLVGGRADASRIRPGVEELRIEGRFTDPEHSDEIVLARTVPTDGRSRAYIDGRLATVGELAEVGRRLVDLHGQHTHQSLREPAVQRDALDRYAGPDALGALADYRAARAESRTITEQLAGLGGDERSRARELDLLRFQVDEIEAAGVEDSSEDVALEAEEALLDDAAAHRDALLGAHADVEGLALDAVGRARQRIGDRAPFAELTERLRAAEADLADVSAELRTAGEGVADDPVRLEEVRARRKMLRELTRKYGATLAEVLAYADETRARIESLQSHDQQSAELEAARAQADARAQAAARALSAARQAATGPLAKAVAATLVDLAMPAARFEISIEPGEATDDGIDDVTFLVSANAGEPLRPLARVASGGELSRAMLAVRVVLTLAPPTLVFDEVDAGLGGETGGAVGRRLGQLGVDHQVLCVTHLAQVAAYADAQVVVEKREQGGRTVATAERVSGDQRVAELSRMLAGVGESRHARSHAAELLDAAAQARTGGSS
jgi:DNA repair protein RecN (Recombination protein N)